MLNVYKYFKQMQDENVILYFKGEITNNLLTSILQLIDDRLGKRSEDIKIKKKVFSILLECLQNVYNYQQSYKYNNEYFEAATLMIKRTENAYYIITGNYMENSKVPTLKARLDKVNTLSHAQLKSLYKEILNRPGPAKSGGAGLGIIDMARKSGEKIGFSFDKVNEKYCFYSLQVKITV